MIVGVAMVRDEEDIIGYCCRHLLEQDVDHLIIADNLSVDSTRDILEGFRGSVTIVEDKDPAYDQSAKMTRLAAHAFDIGARWVLPFDADEWWYAPDSTIGAALVGCDARVVQASGWDHRPTRVDVPSLNPFEALPYRERDPQRLPKVAFRADPHVVVHNGNHDADRPGDRVADVLLYRHFQWRSLEQMTRKVRQGKEALEAAGLHYQYGTHWRHLGSLSDQDLKLYWEDLQDTPGLVYDPVP